MIETVETLERDRDAQVEELFRALLAELPSYARLPLATYRVQVNHAFGFRDAAGIVDYLHALGISDLYSSPILKAAPGSMHGYDVVDHRELNPELGGDAGYEVLSAALAARGMGHLLDFVPNHMAIGSQNALWMDVLENGPSSIYAHVFDIDWKPVKEELANRVLVPILGDQYGAVLERGELVLQYEGGSFSLRYYEHVFPVAPRQYTQILKHRLDELRQLLGEQDVHLQDLLSIIHALSQLPPRAEHDPTKIDERNREKEVVKRRLTALCEASAPVRQFIEENVRIFNGTPGNPRSFDLLDALLREQAYRLAFWRVAAEEINYRRFFDINSLAAIRMEDPHVMRMAHERVLQLLADRRVTGLRIDHPDGLYGPARYFAQVQEEFAVTVARRLWMRRAAPEGSPAEIEARWQTLEPQLRDLCRRDAAGGAESPLFRPVYMVAEKILAGDERIPRRWAIHGTTGYDFLGLVNGLCVDGRNAAAVEDVFARFTGLRLDYAELVYQKRRQVMSDSLSSELNMLARQLNRISEHDRRTRDFTLNILRRGLIEVIACFPVYRTYVSEGGGLADEHDREVVLFAVRRARRKNPTVNASIFDFIRDVLLGRTDLNTSDAAQLERRQLVLKLQQVTAPVMAKAVEDTVFYIYNRLVSLNEVGADPSRFGTTPEQFHARVRERAAHWPAAVNTTSTHDTKRSEDVRARIDVLSEIPGEWKKRLSTWARLNRRHKVRVGEAFAPDANEEMLLYQTLLGAWPFEPLEGEVRDRFVARVQAYMLKAIREAKVNTSWTNPDEDWERGVNEFVAALLEPRKADRFVRDLKAFLPRIARAGAFNSLSQVLLKLALPGVPDLYQGQELWDLSLVDPDNRRPVDYAQRRHRLAELEDAVGRGREPLARDLVANLEDGRIKLYLTWQMLRLRRAFPELLRSGDYLPLAVVGDAAAHLVGAVRRRGEQHLVALAPRLVTPLLERDPNLADERCWRDTFVEIPDLAPGTWLVDLFTGRAIEIAGLEGGAGIWAREAFAGFPLVLALPEAMLARMTR